MDIHNVNWLAVAVAALSGFVIGGLWYGKPLFQKPWMRYSGMSFEKGRQQNMALVFGGAYVMNFVGAFGLAMLLGGRSGWALGLHSGVMTGVFFIATALAVIYLFESRPFGLWVINAGYQVVNFAAMGAIVGAWH
jgi:hypothetical protein